MVIKVVCGNCSYVFYHGNRVMSVDSILKRYGEKCPKCLRDASLKSYKISIKLRHEVKPVGDEARKI